MPTPAVDVSLAVELLSARLTNDADNHGALGLVCPEIRGHDLQLRSHFDVGIHGLPAVASRVKDVGTVRRDVQRPSTGPVRRQAANRSTAGALIVSGDGGLVYHA